MDPNNEIMVPRAGVEPARGCPQRFLSSITACTRSFAGVRREYKSTLTARSTVRRRSPKFALTAVKLLSNQPVGERPFSIFLGLVYSGGRSVELTDWRVAAVPRQG